MLHTKSILAAVSASALMALAAGTAQAQEYGRGGGSSRGTGKFQFAIGGEVWTDSRGVLYSDASFNQIAATNTLDERTLEHDADHVFQHHGTFVTIGGRLDMDMPVRFGVRFGSFTSNNRASAYNPGAAREVLDIVTRPGFATGLFADIKVPLSGGAWIGGTFDFYYGMASIDNVENNFGGFVLEGDYSFFLPELSARFGFDVNNTGCSPFLGFEFSFYQGMWELEDPMATAPGALESIEGTVGNWSFLRLIFGVEFEPDGSPMMARLQVAIWNPGRDFGGALEVQFPFG